MTKEQALALFDVLTDNRLPASVSYRHYECMLPSEDWKVSVSVGPGSMGADDLQACMNIADNHGCAVHLIGDGLLFLPVEK